MLTLVYSVDHSPVKYVKYGEMTGFWYCWHCWLGHQTCKNRRPCNLYCVGADVKPCSISQSNLLLP